MLSAWFSKNIWMVGDTKLFFRMAEVIVSGGVPYVDFVDPKPPLIFFTLAAPVALGQQLSGGLLLVGACNFISALVVMRMAHGLYGRARGLLAGFVFLANMALVEGFFILTEPFTTLFILLSAYALLFMDKKYAASGVFAGIAIGFKQYALLLIPLALLHMYRNKETAGALPFLAGVLAPLLAIYGFIGLAYGPAALQSSLYWSFGVADEYFTQGHIGDIPAYMAPSIGVALANVFLECGIMAPLLLLALAGALSGRRLSRREEFFLLAAAAFLSLLAIRQYLHYFQAGRSDHFPDKIILLTPNEGLSRQHLEELHLSGFGFSQFFNKAQTPARGTIEIIDINKARRRDGRQDRRRGSVRGQQPRAGG